MDKNLAQIKSDYEQNGYVSGLKVIDKAQAAQHRLALETAEEKIGTLHYKPKIHTLLKSPYELVTFPSVLDIVEQFIGHDILLYNVTYIIKEPGSNSHVSWHQDLTYWGLSHDDQVSMWLALSPATKESGCMRMVPGSHRNKALPHKNTHDQDNVLFQGQTVEGVSEEGSVLCPLQPGEASFHHGWTLHSSAPNTSNDRRIGLNVQFIAPHVRQLKQATDSALLVRGTDNHYYYEKDTPASCDIDIDALTKQAELETHYKSIAASS